MSTTQINGATQVKANSIGAGQVDATVIVAAGTNAFTGNQSVGGFKLTNLATPTSSGDAVTKAYVDTAVTGLLEDKGGLDCSANPNYPAANKGDAYHVTVAGKIGGASGISVDISDVIVASADNAGGTQASVGASWYILEHNLVGALLAANNLSDVASAASARGNLGGTTVGQNLFTAANPSAIRYIRVNADNSITFRTAAELATDLNVTTGTQVTRETPAGTVNGSNVTFTLANTPVSGSESLFLNGILQDSGAGNDYTISGLTITYLAAPVSGDKLRVNYRF